MHDEFYQKLVRQSLQGRILDRKTCYQILTSSRLNLLKLLNAAFAIREKFWGRDVLLHIINNVQNGHCGEDCHYCAQSRFSKAAIPTYPMKSDREILKEARLAYQAGAFRYCLVFSGREQGSKRIERLVSIIRQIKKKFPLEVCVSPGFITSDQARILKKAGLNRLNHNINTSKNFYKKICSTHEFAQRLGTLRAAESVGLEICSGVIVGMGESPADVANAALTLREHRNVKSIPVNFFLPIRGTRVFNVPQLTPEYCLRVLCLYRFLNPRAEIRIAAGREYHLRDLQVLGLYPANSIFLDGYLNVQGASRFKTFQMIKDAGFQIKSEQKIDDLIAFEKKFLAKEKVHDKTTLSLKTRSDLCHTKS